uniref:Uncharacterized protein n=1 Tax=Lepeophtheirus salmonis TaxID=72036 RepID=A0A0K2T9F2_LEPSM
MSALSRTEEIGAPLKRKYCLTHQGPFSLLPKVVFRQLGFFLGHRHMPANSPDLSRIENL